MISPVPHAVTVLAFLTLAGCGSASSEQRGTGEPGLAQAGAIAEKAGSADAQVSDEQGMAAMIAAARAAAPVSRDARGPDPIAFGIRPFPAGTLVGDSPDLIAKAEGHDLRWLQYETTLPAGSVIAFYKGQAIAAGLTAATDRALPLGRSTLLEMSRPDGRVLNLSTLEEADGKIFIDPRIGTNG